MALCEPPATGLLARLNNISGSPPFPLAPINALDDELDASALPPPIAMSTGADDGREEDASINRCFVTPGGIRFPAKLGASFRSSA